MRLYVIGANGQIARSLRERAGYIDRNQIAKLGLALGKSDYAKYVQALADRAPVTERPSQGGGSVVV